MHHFGDTTSHSSLTTPFDQFFFTYCDTPKDNGQHFGDHREPAGKRQAYESDVLVPFLVRGPGIPKGSTSSQVVQNVDLGPTFLEIASTQTDSNNRLKPTYPMDGKSILPLLRSNPHSSNYNDFRWAALLEMYGGSSNMGKEYEDVKGYFHNYMVRFQESRGGSYLVRCLFLIRLCACLYFQNYRIERRMIF